MKHFMLVLFTLCLAVLATVVTLAHAGDSGSYFDPDRNREGMMLERNGDSIFFILFTYGADSDCGEPQVSPSIFDCDIDGQRWFFAVNKWDGVDQSVRGFLSVTQGINFPFGFEGEVGEAEAVGRYILAREGDGYLLFVQQFGNELDEDDPLFREVIDLRTRVMVATD